jgi:DHA2 family multidrug resistance protein
VSDGSPGGQGSDERNWRPSANPWLIAVVVTMAAFMELLDTTIVNVSLPHIAGNLSASYDEATWTLTSWLRTASCCPSRRSSDA